VLLALLEGFRLFRPISRGYLGLRGRRRGMRVESPSLERDRNGVLYVSSSIIRYVLWKAGDDRIRRICRGQVRSLECIVSSEVRCFNAEPETSEMPTCGDREVKRMLREAIVNCE
jgi:hypothetical protein